MSSVSAGVVNLQVWQLIGLFTTGTRLRNTWQPAACEGCIGMIVEWFKSSQNVQQISLHLSQIDSRWGTNLGVREVDLGASLRSSVIQRDQCEGLWGQVLQAGYKQWKRHAVKSCRKLCAYYINRQHAAQWVHFIARTLLQWGSHQKHVILWISFKVCQSI